MMRIAQEIAKREGALALVTGDSIGQVGTQTLRNMATIEEAIDMPVLRPLVGMDKQEITNQAIALNSYEISILPDEDCCTLFVPKSPSTRVRVEEVLPMEAAMNVDAMVAQAVEEAELVEYHIGVPAMAEQAAR
jgi:thiamine biosynthesis protein ThiI